MPSGRPAKSLPGTSSRRGRNAGGSRRESLRCNSSSSSTPSPTRATTHRVNKKLINGGCEEDRPPDHVSDKKSSKDFQESSLVDNEDDSSQNQVTNHHDTLQLNGQPNHLQDDGVQSSILEVVKPDQPSLINGHDEVNNELIDNVITSVAHTNISNNSEDIVNGKDNIDVNIVITEDEVISPSKEIVESATEDLLLSPIKPASGETLNLRDAILISPRRMGKLDETLDDRNITVNLVNSTEQTHLMDIEDEFLCNSTGHSPPNQNTIQTPSKCFDEDEFEMQDILEKVPDNINDHRHGETVHKTTISGSTGHSSETSSLRSSPSLDSRNDTTSLMSPELTRRGSNRSCKKAARKSITQSPTTSRSSSIDSADINQEASRSKVKSRRGSKISSEDHNPVKKENSAQLDDNLLKNSVFNRRKMERIKKEELTPVKTEPIQSDLTDVKAEVSLSEKLQSEEEDRREVDKRLKSFRHITENHYLCQRKINKQFRKMQCDCEPRDDETVGCGDDCANKMLMIECSKDCLLDNKCGNKRFQNKENAAIEVFRTDWKGVGVRATKFIPKDTFIMEYVGEALDHKQFRRRAKQYSRNNVEHFYFMALSADCYVDATNKGNISRFINHSCDPNSETQKWIVNGENRVGFFTKRDVKALEELNFDYKYERYGQAAQKCYCGTSICRGWLGKEPTSDSGIDEAEEWTTSEEEMDAEDSDHLAQAVKTKDQKLDVKSDQKVRAERDAKRERRRKKAEERRRWQEEQEWNEEIERLASSGIKNRIHTLQLCRLMVRASTTESKSRLAKLLLEADQPCRRLFLDYQGLRILSQWMQDLEWSPSDLEVKLQIEAVLTDLPIPHRTMLKDTKVWWLTQVWSLATKENPNPNISNQNKSSSRSETTASSSHTKSTCSSTSTTDVASTTQTSTTDLASTTETAFKTDNVPYSDSNQSAKSSMQQSTTEIKPSEEEDLYPPGEEPPSPSTSLDTPNQSKPSSPPCVTSSPVCESQSLPATHKIDEQDEIQVVGELTTAKCTPSTGRTVSRSSSQDSKSLNKNKMQLDVQVFSSAEGGDSASAIAKVLTLQSEVGGEDKESGLDIIVLPNQREKLALDEDEETSFLISQVAKVQQKAKELLKRWSLLQEVFKIPKKERHKLRVEHEREVDRYYNQNRGHTNAKLQSSRYSSQDILTRHNNIPRPEKPVFTTPERSHQISVVINQTPDQRKDVDIAGPRTGSGHKNRYDKFLYDRSRQSTVIVPRERKNLRLDDKEGKLHCTGLSRDQRRTMFEAKVKEEARQKSLRLAINSRHAHYCRYLYLKPEVTPLFDKYPEYFLVGDRWVDIPKVAELEENFVVPSMAWLPDEAYRASDPKAVNARDIYPPGVCPPEPPPAPRIIRVPGKEATEWDVMMYYEEMYRRQPKSEPTSPTQTDNLLGKRKIPPYPGHELLPSLPEVIFFDPTEVTPEDSPAPPAPVPAPVPPPALPGSGTGTPQFPGTPAHCASRPASRASQTGSVVGTPLPQITSSSRKSVSSGKKSRESTADKTSRTMKRRSLEQDYASQAQDNILMDKIRAELKLGDGALPLPGDVLMSPPLNRIQVDSSPDDYRSPSPVQRDNTNSASPSPTPTSTSRFTSEMSRPETPDSESAFIKRSAPKVIDFLDSEANLENSSSMFWNNRDTSRVQSSAEMELCDSLSVHYNTDVGLPVASTVTQANTNGWQVDSVEVSGIAATNEATAANNDLTVRLPRNWRAARDSSGRVYYYHVEEMVPQWELPVSNERFDQESTVASSDESVEREEIPMETNSSDDEEEEDSDEEKENGEETEETEAEPIEESQLVQDYDLSASEKKMLLRMRDRSQSAKLERSNRRKAKRRAERERREQEREMLEARSERHRTNGLVSEYAIPRDRNNSVAKEIRLKLKNKEEILRQIDEEIMRDELTERQEQDRIRREQIKAEKSKKEIGQSVTRKQEIADINIPITSTVPSPAPNQPQSRTSAVHTAPADTSSETERKARDKFVKEMSAVIVKALDPFRNPKSKGHIKTNEDFKHLAKKLTYVIYEKERTRTKPGIEIKITDKMKEKASEYVKKKMSTYDKEYKRSPAR